MKKKAIIIGGGMAGLSAGCYLRMNDIDTEIFEMHTVPGGVCTAWQKGDYLVDLCIHWLVGSGPADGFYERWSELIDMERIQFVDHEEYLRVEDEHGRQLIIYTNVDRLEEELLTKAPEDERLIREFTAAIRKLTRFEMPSDKAPELANLWDRAKMTWNLLPYLGILGKFMRLPAADYAKKFKNPLLRKAMAEMFEPEIGLIFQLFTLAWMHKKTAGYPIGGSMRFAEKVFRRYRQLGGQIQFGSRVERVLVEDDRAVGIRLEDGSEHFADYVISAADGHATLFDMLDGRYLDRELAEWYQDMPTFPSLVFVALGVDQVFEGDPHALIFPVEKPIRIDPDTEHTDLYLRILNFDPTLAPEGKTLLTLMLETKAYDYWHRLYRDQPERYRAEKDRIAGEVLDALDLRLGGIREKVEMVDVSTPATFNRFTGNWKGSFEGWMLTPEAGFKSLGHRLPGLERFFMCGHWVEVGGGLPAVLRSGRIVAELICSAEDRPFRLLPLSETEEKEIELSR